jgi:hypothetical protein
MVQLDLIIVIGLAVLLTSYAVQAVLSVLNAARPRSGSLNPNSPTEPSAKPEQSLLSRLFKGVPQITSTWSTIGLVFILPVVVAWLAGFSSVTLVFDWGPFVYSGSVSTLIVLLTLELSQLNDLNPNNRDDWRGLLLMACALDLSSLFLLAWPIKLRVHQGQHPDWSSVATQILILTAGSLASGLLVVLFAKKAGES